MNESRSSNGSSPAQAHEPEVTRDTLLRGRVVVHQPARGYRFSLDPVLLSGFVSLPLGRFIDLGAGSGVLSFLLLARDPHAAATAIEIQPRLAALAARGAAENGMTERLTLVANDFLAWAQTQAQESFDVVASNPPFYTVEGGHLSPNPERALAHHEVALPLHEWTAAAARLLTPSGRIAVVFPAERKDALFEALQRQGFGDVRLRWARPTQVRPVHRLLVEASRGQPRVRAEDDLIVHTSEGEFSHEVKGYLGENS
ncbi:MAG: methyltransferase [Deltaproteobacteria bacterium]|nr:methyltransferase [Deltaproteobacteria bacterium]